MNVLKFNKLALVICFVILNIGIASSQIRFGVKGGFDLNNNRVNKDILNANNRLGFQAGGTMEVMVPFIGWGGEASLLYGRQDFNVKNIKGNDNKNYDLSSYNYLRVPVNLKKKFSVLGLFGVFVSAGPYAEFKLGGADFKQTAGSVDVKEDRNKYKSKSFGMGINAGAGVDLLKHLEIGMYYRKSLTNNYSADKPSIGDYLWKKKPSDWSINLTYFF